MQVMRMAKDVEEELKEEDDEGDRYYGKNRMGRSEPNGLLSKSQNGSNLIHKDFTRFNSGGYAPSQKTGSTGSNTIPTSSMNSTGRKGENDRRTLSSERWKGVRGVQSDEITERRAKGLCFKCGGKYHPTLHK